MRKNVYVYITSNKHRTVFYTGMTNNMERRLYEHRNGIGSKFVKKYNVVDLLLVEHFFNADEAVSREKQIKGWRSEKKLALIRRVNPELRDLAKDYGIQ